MENNEINQPMNKKQTFLRFMRYVAVGVVTVWLLVLFIASTDEDDFLAVFMVVAAIVAFFFTIPIIGFWIYSFVKSISNHTKTDRIFLWVHIADLLLLGGVVYMLNRPPMKCDAFIMAECYNGEPVFGCGIPPTVIVIYCRTAHGSLSSLRMAICRNPIF